LNPCVTALPVLIVNPYSRCNCRCVMCDIWQGTEVTALSRDTLERQLASLANMQVRWVVFSGGEPLMHPDIFELCQAARKMGARVTVLTTGILLNRFANAILDHVDDLIVSLDGPETIHDHIRRVEGAYQILASGITRLHSLNPDFPVAGRCTVQSLNCGSLLATVEAARQIGFSSLSFLAVDVHSTAFNRATSLTVLRQSGLAVGIEQLPVLESQIEEIIRHGYCGGFVVESPMKLRRVAHHFRCHWNMGKYVAPTCNAPWVSAVLEANGNVRPCFFHPAIGTISSGESLTNILNSPAAVEFRSTLDVKTNPLCRRCVCSLNWRDVHD
jgi:MoaA/NifB/PqqE/SkfB family radical SAM enzyme